MNKIPIKLIIFDAYGVCLNEGYPNTSKYLAKKYRRHWKDIQKVLYYKYFNRAAIKKITQNKAWQKAIDELGLPLTIEQAKKIHYDLMKLNSEIIALAGELKKHYIIALLSKNTRSQFHDIEQRFPKLRQLFGKNMINAWEYDLPKTSKETVAFLCKRFKVKPREILYFDDQEVNLKAPKEMGVNTIFYKNFAQFKKELKHYLAPTS